MSRLTEILNKAENGVFLSKSEMIHLLELSGKESQQLFEVARRIRDRHFNHKIFLYGFVYFSTHCRNNCAFCFYRRSNESSIRYSKDLDEILTTAVSLAEAGIHLVDLTLGEDPAYVQDGEAVAKLADIITQVKRKTGLPVMISPGVLDQQMLQQVKAAGADWYACYQETHNRDIFRRLRLEQDFDVRMNAKRQARKIGLLTEEGLLSGVGESIEDIADSMLAMRELAVDQVRVMSFVPQEGTTMQGWETPERQRELLIIALMRILFPDRLIPASLDVDGIVGLKPRLDAGANVVTSIIPPLTGLAGVSQNTLDIDDGNRTVESAQRIINECNLQVATASDYQNWLEQRKKMLM